MTSRVRNQSLGIPRPELVSAFATRSASNALVVVTGEGGSGKSQLVTDAAEQKGDGRTLYYHSFYNSVLHRLGRKRQSQTSDILLRDVLLGFLKDVAPSRVELAKSQPSWGIAHIVADVVQTKPCCLILDAVECVHDPDRNKKGAHLRPGEQQPKGDGGRDSERNNVASGPREPAIAELLEALMHLSQTEGVCVFTHRDAGLVPAQFRFEVPQLGESELVPYLRGKKIGFNERSLSECLTSFGGRAIVWRSVASLLSIISGEQNGESPSLEMLKDVGLTPDAVRANTALDDVIAAIDRRVCDRHEEWGWWLVRLAGCFDRPARWELLQALADEFRRRGCADVRLPSADIIHLVAKNLQSTGLGAIENGGDGLVVDVHQDVRNYYASWLRHRFGEQWSAGHARLSGELFTGVSRSGGTLSGAEAASHVPDLVACQRGIYHASLSSRAAEPSEELLRWFDFYWNRLQAGYCNQLVLDRGLVDVDQDFLAAFKDGFVAQEPKGGAVTALTWFYWCRNAWHLNELKDAYDGLFETAQRLLRLGWVASAANAWRHRSEICGVLGAIGEALSYGKIALQLLLAGHFSDESSEEKIDPDRNGGEAYRILDMSAGRREPIRLYCKLTLARAHHFAGQTLEAENLFKECGPGVASLPNWALVWWYWRADWFLDHVCEQPEELAALRQLFEDNERAYKNALDKRVGSNLPPLDEGLYRLIRCHVQTRLALLDTTSRRQLLNDARSGPFNVETVRVEIGKSYQRPWAVVGNLECARIYLALGRVADAEQAAAEAERVATLKQPTAVAGHPVPVTDGILWAYLVDVRLIQAKIAVTRFRAEHAEEQLAIARQIIEATGYYRRDGDTRRLRAAIDIVGILQPAFEIACAALDRVRLAHGKDGLDSGRELLQHAVNDQDLLRDVRQEHDDRTDENRRKVEQELQPVLEALRAAAIAAVEQLTTGGLAVASARETVRSLVLTTLERPPQEAFADLLALKSPPRRKYAGRGDRPPEPNPKVDEELCRLAEACATVRAPLVGLFQKSLDKIAYTSYESSDRNKQLVAQVNAIAQLLDVRMYARHEGREIGPVTLAVTARPGAKGGSFLIFGTAAALRPEGDVEPPKSTPHLEKKPTANKRLPRGKSVGTTIGVAFPEIIIKPVDRKSLPPQD